MKRLLISVFSILLIISIFSFFTSCSDVSGSGTTADDGTITDMDLVTEYIVKFTADGTEYSFCNSKGRMWGEPEAGLRDDNTLFITGSEDNSDGSYMNYILLSVYNVTDTGPSSYVHNLVKYDVPPDEPLINTTDTANLTYIINKFEDVGGTIEGTFSGTINDSDTPILITDGYLCVKRIALEDISL